jgi:hypothetical protein
MVLGRHPEKDIQRVLAARQFLKGYRDVVPGVKAQVKTQHGLRGRYGAGQIFPDLTRLKHGQVRIKDVDVPVRARQHQDLPTSQRGAHQEAG